MLGGGERCDDDETEEAPLLTPPLLAPLLLLMLLRLPLLLPLPLDESFPEVALDPRLRDEPPPELDVGVAWRREMVGVVRAERKWPVGVIDEEEEVAEWPPLERLEEGVTLPRPPPPLVPLVPRPPMEVVAEEEFEDATFNGLRVALLRAE